jgi:hypothetical protein
MICFASEEAKQIRRVNNKSNRLTIVAKIKNIFVKKKASPWDAFFKIFQLIT